MSLIIFNGSPRGDKSNSHVITNWFMKGYQKSEIKECFLFKFKQHDFFIEELNQYEECLFVFPLYADGMPGIVKSFYEKLIQRKELIENKRITFIIHSGFAEAVHLRPLEQYNEILAKRLGCIYSGTIIIPGSEGFRLMPDKMLRRKINAVERLGKEFMNNSSYNPFDLKLLSGREVLKGFSKFVFKILSKTGLSNQYWNKMLKSNGAYEKRFNKPYE